MDNFFSLLIDLSATPLLADNFHRFSYIFVRDTAFRGQLPLIPHLFVRDIASRGQVPPIPHRFVRDTSSRGQV